MGCCSTSSSCRCSCRSCNTGRCCKKTTKGCPDGRGIICVENIAALAKLDATKCKDLCTLVKVRSVDQLWELDKTSEADPDGITIVAAKGGGNWIRTNTFSGHWASLYGANPAYFDAVNGDDEADGLSEATATKTVAEICRRLSQIPRGKPIVINQLSDVPAVEATTRPFGTVPVADTYNPSSIHMQNPESIDSSGNDQVINVSLVGKFKVLTSGTFSAASTGSTGNVQATITTATSLAAYVGRLVRITSIPGALADDVRLGALAGIGRDAGGGVYWTTDFLNVTNLSFTGVLPLGTTFDVVQGPAWNRPLDQIAESQGRYIFSNLEFPEQPANADQANITMRFVNTNFLGCRFRRTVQMSFGANAGLFACVMDYTGLTGTGVAGTVICSSLVGSALSPINSLLINADLRYIQGGDGNLASSYFERSIIQTANPTTLTPNYGFTLFPSATSGSRIQIAGNGIRSYDWPIDASTDNAAVLVTDGSTVRVGSGNIGGTTTTATAVGVMVRNNSALLIADALAPADASWINGGGGGGANIRIRNPGGTVDLAVRAGNAPLAPTDVPSFVTAAGSVIMDAETLSVWDNWTGVAADQFGKYAFNPLDGSRVAAAA